MSLCNGFRWMHLSITACVSRGGGGWVFVTAWLSCCKVLKSLLLFAFWIEMALCTRNSWLTNQWKSGKLFWVSVWPVPLAQTITIVAAGPRFFVLKMFTKHRLHYKEEVSRIVKLMAKIPEHWLENADHSSYVAEFNNTLMKFELITYYYYWYYYLLLILTF